MYDPNKHEKGKTDLLDEEHNILKTFELHKLLLTKIIGFVKLISLYALKQTHL